MKVTLNRLLLLAICLFTFGFPLLIKANIPIAPTFHIFKISPELKVIQILPSVYIIEDQSWSVAPAYSMIVEISANNLLMVDTPYTPQNTAIELKWINKKFGKKRITAINTHYHVDRLGGNEVLTQNNIPVYGSYLTASLLSDPKALNNKWKAKTNILNDISDSKIKREFRSIHFTAPNHLFSIHPGKILYLDDKKVEIFYM